MRRSLAWGVRIEGGEYPSGYWGELWDVARRTEPELALAQHLEQERQRRYNMDLFGDVWRHSTEYARACRDFDVNVLAVLAREVTRSERFRAKEEDARAG